MSEEIVDARTREQKEKDEILKSFGARSDAEGKRYITICVEIPVTSIDGAINGAALREVLKAETLKALA